MRIRKNAKLSSLIFPQGSRRDSVYVCQLNQSPWDVIPFQPLHRQFEGEDSVNGNGSLGNSSVNGNGSLGNSIGAVESVTSESDEKAIMKVEGIVIDDNDDNYEMKIAKQFGFKSQCEEEEEEKESKQEDLLKSCNNNNSRDGVNNPSSLTSKKAEKNNQLTGNRRGRGRAEKGSSSASNPYEFYYYSGFGPLWGKRRGCSDSKNIIDENSSAITTQNNTTPSSSSQIDNNEEFDYVDDEEEDYEDDENIDSGKKRMRKPIKARSLKSLM